MKNIAIATIAYNRIDSIKRLLTSLTNAYYDNDNVTLIISIDKSNTDIVEKYADSFVWQHGEKRVIKHSKNLGLRKHILSIGNFLEEFDAIIVLEDDISVADNFYNYAKFAVDEYIDNDNIAGVSLYSYRYNPHTRGVFTPDFLSTSDVYYIQWAPSWGQIWMKKQWQDFKKWYNENDEEFVKEDRIPKTICDWGPKSWLKYHTKYAIKNKKYFVYPYIALSTCNGDAGVHTFYNTSLNQVPLLTGKKTDYKFQTLSNAIIYDAYFERKDIKIDGYTDICIDLNGFKDCQYCGCRYILTTQLLPYKVVKSYNLSYRPIERNIDNENEGYGIFLYDTNIKANKPPKSDSYFLYKYSIANFLLLIQEYKLINICRSIIKSLNKKIKK